ncbi:MAG: 5-oxoprolinase subunit PxpB [Paracoccaceae bacterium]
MDDTPEAAARFLPFGEAALLVEFGEAIDRRLSRAVLALDRALAAAEPIAGVVETAPSFRSLLVTFDPLATDAQAVETAIRERLSGLDAGEAPASRRWRLPACYEGDLALDLDEVARTAELTTAEVIERHAGAEHHVYMIGFLPGCPYLGDLDPALDRPRRAEPRTAVPKGSVAIAVGLTVVYPVTSPGGWHVLARTPVGLFAASAEPPALLSPGDGVRFEPVGRAEFDRLEKAVAAGEWAPEPEASS